MGLPFENEIPYAKNATHNMFNEGDRTFIGTPECRDNPFGVREFFFRISGCRDLTLFKFGTSGFRVLIPGFRDQDPFYTLPLI